MKTFFLTIASLILLVNTWLMSSDLMAYNRRCMQLKYIAEEASCAGALYMDNEAYSEMTVQFDDTEALVAVKDIIVRNMNLNSSMVPQSDSYWKSTVSITVYIFDDTGCREYRDGALIRQFSFTYPYLYTDNTTDFSQAIARPTVCVTIDAGTRHLGGGLLNLEPVAKRSGSHEVVYK